MKIKKLIIENFRAYKEKTEISFDDLTTIIGRNDIGKSTVLEAMEIFFNNKSVPIDKFDANVDCDHSIVTISAEFCELPNEVNLDAGAVTTLQDEFLLSSEGTLLIKKIYDCTKAKPTPETFVVSQHPTADGAKDLLQLKEIDLQKRVKAIDPKGPLKGNPVMREFLRNNVPDLKVEEVETPIAKATGDGKRIWEQIELRLPMFALFQSDRNSKDTDGEVQNPLKGAIATAISEAKAQIEQIEKLVREKSEEIASLTHEALAEIDPDLASSLTPKFSSPTSAKWTGLFSLGMDTNGNIPLNKRGSGVRRLILVSFFKAEAERKLVSSDRANIIYAIEEPETSQHPSNQKILIDSFQEISNTPNCQIVLTTHSPGLAGELPKESIRFIDSDPTTGHPVINQGTDVFGEVADALGLIPDGRVKVLVCVEGPTDIPALKELSRALNDVDANIPNLGQDPRFAFVSFGGSALKHWVSENYLAGLGLPEIHLYDNDVATYQASVDEVNARTDGLGSYAALTKKHEIESYLHSEAIFDEFGITVNVVDAPDGVHEALPEEFAKVFSAHKGYGNVLGSTKAKKHLSKAFKMMNAARLRERDPDDEIKEWLQKAGDLAQ